MNTWSWAVIAGSTVPTTGCGVSGSGEEGGAGGFSGALSALGEGAAVGCAGGDGFLLQPKEAKSKIDNKARVDKQRKR